MRLTDEETEALHRRRHEPGAPLRYPPTERERYWLLRRRAGLTQAEVASDLGVSRLWVCRMERGGAPADRLREYWRGE